MNPSAPAGGVPPEPFVRDALRRWEFDFRADALAALAAWDAAGVPPPVWLGAVPELYFALAAVQRPSWGHWNGLLTAVRKARAVVLSTPGPAHDALLVRGADLGRVLDRLDAPLPAAAAVALIQLRAFAGGSVPAKPRGQHAFALLITLRNRIAHDAPADGAWWAGTAAALRALNEQFATDPGTPPEPWAFTEAGDLWTFNGLRDDLVPVFTSRAGAVRDEPGRAAGVVAALRRLLGRADAQDRDFRQLLTRLAPDELRGVVLGDYLMGPPVGEGGFARVHVARQLSTGRKVALKVLHDGADAADRARFRAEAAHLARFSSPAIVQVIGHGDETWTPPRQLDLSGEPWFQELQRSGRVKTFIALEWVDGRTLDAHVTADRPDAATATEWFAQAAEALAVVHAAGMLHRDVTPRNLIVNGDGRVKLMDFGIARDRADADRLRTHTGRVVGTPAYMSPEQLAAADAQNRVGAAADVYSLCATFYEVFTGTRLYDHDTADAGTVLTQKLDGRRPAAPRALAPGVPWQVETLLLGGLEREPADRPVGAAELAADLRRALRNEPTVYRRPPLRRRLQLAYRRNRTLANLTAVFLLLLGGGGAAANALLAEQGRETADQRSRADDEEQGRIAAQKKAEQEQEKTLKEQKRADDEKEQKLKEGKRADEEQKRADDKTRLAKEESRKRLSQEYAADMQAVPALWEGGRVDLIRRLLAKYETPGPDGDPRALEWFMWRRAEATNRSFESPASSFRAVSAAGGRAFTLDSDGTVRAWDLATLREVYSIPGKAMVLAVSPDGKRLATADPTGVTVHDGETGGGAKQLGRFILVSALAFSADGSKLLAGDYGSNLHLWDMPAGKYVINLSDNPRSVRQVNISPQSLDKHGGPVRAVAFSPDGKLAASGSDDATIKVFEVATGRYVGPNRVRGTNAVVAHTGPVSSIAFAPDGRTALSGSVGERDRFGDAQKPGEVKLWDVKTGEILQTLTRHVDAVAFEDGRKGGDYRVAFSADGAKLLACAEKGVNVWDASSGKLVEELKGAEARVVSLAVAAGGVVVAVAEDKKARLWKPGGSPLFNVLATHAAGTRALAVSADGANLGVVCEPGYGLAVGLGGSRQTRTQYDYMSRRVWDARTGEPRETIARGAARAPWLPTEAFEDILSPDGRWQTKPDGTTATVLKARDGGAARTLDLPPLPPHAPNTSPPFRMVVTGAFSRDSRWLAAGGEFPEAYLWEVESGKIRMLPGHTGAVRAVAFRADGAVLATGDDAGVVRLWDVATGKKLRDFGGHPREIAAIAFSPDNRRLAVAVGTLVVKSNRPGEVRLWDLDTGFDLLTLTAGPNRVYCGVGFAPDGRRLYATANPLTGPTPDTFAPGEVIVWDGSDAPGPVSKAAAPAVRAPVVHCNLHAETPTAVAFDPRGERLAVGTLKGTVRLVDAATGEVVHGWEPVKDMVRALAFSPGGGKLVSVNLGNWERAQPAVLDPRTGGRAADVKRGEDDRTIAAAFAPDGKRFLHLYTGDGAIRLAGAGPDGAGVVLDGPGAKSPVPISGTAAFSPDGRWLVAGGSLYEAKTVRAADFGLWDTETGKLVRQFGGLTDPAFHVAFSPDGGFVAAATAERVGTFYRAKGVVVWRVETGERVHSYAVPGDDIGLGALALGPGGGTLAVAACEEGDRHGVVRVVELATGKSRVLPLAAAGGALAFSPDGRFLATASGGSATVWDLASDKLPTAPAPHTFGYVERLPMFRRELVTVGDFGGPVRAIAFTPSGERVAAASGAGRLKVLKAQTGRVVSAREVPAGTADQLAVRPEDESVVGLGAGKATAWDGATGDPGKPVALPGRVLAVAYPGGKKPAPVLTTEDDGKTYSVREGEGKPFVVPELTGPAPQVALSPDGKWVAVAVGPEVKVYALAGAPRPPVAAPAKGPKGPKVAAPGPDDPRFVFKTPGATAEHLTFSAHGEALAATLGTGTGAERRTTKVVAWDLPQGRQEWEAAVPFGPARTVTGLAVGRLGSFVAVAAGPPLGGTPPGAYLYVRGKGWLAVPVPTGSASSVAFNTDGSQLAVGGDGELWLAKIDSQKWAPVPPPKAKGKD